MDADSALGLIDRIRVLTVPWRLEGGQLAGLLGAMDGEQLTGLGSERLFDAAKAMKGEHFKFMDADSALGMINNMRFDRALELDGGQLAGLFGAMDAGQYQDMICS